MFLFQLFGLGVPPAGPLLAAQKWAEKPLGRPQTPIVCLIGRYQGRCQAATEFPLGRWPLVIGLAGHGLRLTALGLWVISIFADESICGFHRCRQLVTENNRCICPFNRASAEAGRDTRYRLDARRIL